MYIWKRRGICTSYKKLIHREKRGGVVSIWDRVHVGKLFNSSW